MTEINQMKLSRPNELAKEPQEKLRKRVLMLELLLRDAGLIINTYASEKWIKQARVEFRAFVESDELAQRLAENSWHNCGATLTKNFSYPIPPRKHAEAVQDEISYW